MDPYGRKANGYPHRSSVGNSHAKYQNYDNHNPYKNRPSKQRGVQSSRPHAYSVEQQNAYNQNNPYLRQQNPRKYNYDNNQYAQQQYQIQQQQQQQQLYQLQQEQQREQRRQKKQRKENSPGPVDEPYFFPSNDNNEPNKSKQSRRRQPPQHQYYNNNNNHELNEEYFASTNNKPNRRPPNQRRGGTRSKSPMNGKNRSASNTGGQRRSGSTQRRGKGTKNSVPTVNNTNQYYMNHPSNGNTKGHHNSTPNANGYNPSQRENRQRRRRKKRQETENLVDSDYESTDSGVVYKNTPRRGSQGQNVERGRQKRNKQTNQGGLDYVHEDRVDRARRTKKNRGRSKSPNPYNNEDEPSRGRRESNNLLQEQQAKKRRHTTSSANGGRGRNANRNTAKYAASKSPNGGRGRKKRSSKSPNPRKKSAADLASQHARLNKGALAEQFTIKEKLGRGNFSVVRRVVRKVDGKEFAAKIISTKTMSDQEIKDAQDEVRLLSKLHHPNIVTLIDFRTTPRHLYIVLELLNGGELFERLQKKKKFNERMAANITKQIADALRYMHAQNIVHRDLKPENILYENNSEDAKIKISDFGLSRQITEIRPLTTACGTPGYVAPEIIRQQVYNEAVDLWALGVIIYVLLCGFSPFAMPGMRQHSMFRKIRSGKYTYPKPAWNKISACAVDCIDSLLLVNPKDRMSAKELLEHPWIKQSETQNDDPFMDIHWQSNLSNYLHKKRFRRGVRLIITLNRMIRGAGLEETAREQRRKFRQRLLEHKTDLKAKQRRIYHLQQTAKMNGISPNNIDDDEDEYMGITIIDPDQTPAIDYSKI